MIDYDAELQLHNERLRAAYDIRSADRVLDIGCGAGQTTRDAARLAPDGGALGVDIDAGMVTRARELADAEGVSNVRFEVGDAQRYPLEPAAFDVAISRFGTMFLADLEAAFLNVARAMRAGGRLVMMVWQAHDRNEWAVSIDRAITGGVPAPAAGSSAPDPFSLSEPETVRSILTTAGFTDIRFADVDAPVYYGQDVDAALGFVRRFASVGDALGRGDPTPVASAIARLRETLEAHSSERGVWFDSRAWIVTAGVGESSAVARSFTVQSVGACSTASPPVDACWPTTSICGPAVRSSMNPAPARSEYPFGPRWRGIWRVPRWIRGRLGHRRMRGGE